MATTKRKRAPAKKRNVRKGIPTARQPRRSDEDAWFLIKYCFPAAPDPITEEFDLPPAAPRRLKPAQRTHTATMRRKVKGRRAMQLERAALRGAGATIVSVQQLGWFGGLFG